MLVWKYQYIVWDHWGQSYHGPWKKTMQKLLQLKAGSPGRKVQQLCTVFCFLRPPPPPPSRSPSRSPSPPPSFVLMPIRIRIPNQRYWKIWICLIQLFTAVSMYIVMCFLSAIYVPILWTIYRTFVEMDTNLDQQALDADPAPDPAKWCRFDRIRIRIHNTAFFWVGSHLRRFDLATYRVKLLQQTPQHPLPRPPPNTVYNTFT